MAKMCVCVADFVIVAQSSGLFKARPARTQTIEPADGLAYLITHSIGARCRHTLTENSSCHRTNSAGQRWPLTECVRDARSGLRAANLRAKSNKSRSIANQQTHMAQDKIY